LSAEAIFVNVGRRCGSTEALEAFLLMISDSHPEWAVVFIQELDNSAFPGSACAAAHRVFRHWPGEGSVAMAFVIRDRWRHRLREMRWKGRCGYCQLRGLYSQIRVAGTHVAHGSAAADTLVDLAWCCRRLPADCALCVGGDWNTDYLPTFGQLDRFSQSHVREHRKRRAALERWLGKLHLQLRLPEEIRGLPPPPWSDAGLEQAVTRVPVGDSVGQAASMLDYCACDEKFRARGAVMSYWCLALADHAAVCISFSFCVEASRRAPHTWQPESETSACRAVELLRPPGCWAELSDMVLATQAATHELRTCRERREARVPTQCRQLWAAAAAAADAATAETKRCLAWQCLRAHIRREAEAAAVSRVKQGRWLQKRAGLKKISSLKVSISTANPGAFRRFVEPVSIVREIPQL